MDLTVEIKLRFQIFPACCLQCGLGINVPFAYSTIVLSLFMLLKNKNCCVSLFKLRRTILKFYRLFLYAPQLRA